MRRYVSISITQREKFAINLKWCTTVNCVPRFVTAIKRTTTTHMSDQAQKNKTTKYYVSYDSSISRSGKSIL